MEISTNLVFNERYRFNVQLGRRKRLGWRRARGWLLGFLFVTVGLYFWELPAATDWRKFLIHACMLYLGGKLIGYFLVIPVLAALVAWMSRVQGLYRLEIMEDGIVERNVEGEIHTRWPYVRSLEELPDYLAIELHGDRVLIIPESAFSTTSEMERFGVELTLHVQRCAQDAHRP